MPYIDKCYRDALDSSIDEVINKIKLLYGTNVSPGILNYVISRILTECYDIGNPSYVKLNTIQGILSCCSQEIYRRMAKYEDMKIKTNCDLESFKSFENNFEDKNNAN